MDPVRSKNIKQAIIFTKILDNAQLVVVDSHTTVRYLNIDSLEVVDGFKAGINYLRYKTVMVAFSNDSKLFATISSDLRESKLYNAQTKKAIGKVNRHHGEISCVGIDNQAQFMFSCGDDGKTFAIDTKSGKLAFTLPIHSDTINDIVFSDNGNWIATASYDRRISLFNLSMMTPKHKLKAHTSPIVKLKFLNKNRIFSVDKSAVAIIWNIYSGKVLKRLEGVHDDVTQVVTSTNDEFLFLGTALGYVIVYDLNTYELLSKKYIKLARENKILVKRTALMHYNLGVFYTQNKEYNRAVAEFEKAIELNPEDALAHFNLGFIYAEHFENRPKAIERFNQYLKLAKKVTKMWIGSSAIYLLGRHGKGKRGQGKI